MKRKKNFILALMMTIPLFLSAQHVVSVGDILCTDGSIVRVSEFAASGKTAMGVVYFLDNSGQSGLAVNLYDNMTDAIYGGYGVDFPLPDIENSRDAIYDFQGYKNTAQLRGMPGGAADYPAIWSIDFDNEWYMPASGELRLLYNQILVVNKSLILVGGTPMFDDTDNYWTSTERSPYHMHDLNRAGNMGNYTKIMASNPAFVGVRSIRSFSTNSTGYGIGRIITNEDGSKGVVFYVNPDDNSGWMVALNDAPNTWQWGNKTDTPLSNQQPQNAFNLLSETDGMTNTTILRNHQSNNSYASYKVDIEHGWYLPTAGQLSTLYGVLPFVEDSILKAGGNLMKSAPYWSSTEYSKDNAWYVDYGSPGYYGGFFKSVEKTEYAHVRAVRNFSFVTSAPIVGEITTPDGICPGESLNLTAPQTQYATTEGWQIAPDITFNDYQDYNNETLDNSYNGWFLRYFAANETATTYSNMVQITIWSNFATEFNISRCEPYEWNGQIYTQTGDYEQMFSTVHGCDSIVTMHLSINSINQYDLIERGCDSIIVNGIAYYESGTYEQYRPGGEEACDTIVTLYLTINHLPNVGNIQGRSRIFVDEFGIFDYCIDSVPGAIGYEWSIDNPTWVLNTTTDSPCCQLDVRTTSTGTLRVKVYTECGIVERSLFISHQEMPGFVVFPVPTKGDVTIAIYGLEGENIIEIFDEIGRLIDRISANAIREGITIPYTLRDKATGVYLFKIVGNYYFTARKVVKY